MYSSDWRVVHFTLLHNYAGSILGYVSRNLTRMHVHLQQAKLVELPACVVAAAKRDVLPSNHYCTLLPSNMAAATL